MATQTGKTLTGDPKVRITVISITAPIADDFDLALPDSDTAREIQVGVQMLDSGGLPVVATSGTFDVSAGTPNNRSQLESLGSINAATPTTLLKTLGIDRITVTPNTIVAGPVQDYLVHVTLYPR